MKKIFNSNEITRAISESNIAEKNQYIVEIMNIAYNYIPHNYLNINYILNEFIVNDDYFNAEIKKQFIDKYFNRILIYLKGDTSKYAPMNKALNTTELIPSTIDKIIDYIKNSGINIEEKSKTQLISIAKNALNNITLEEYEKINLEDVEL